MADPPRGPVPPEAPTPAEATEDLFAGRIPLTGGSLRTTAARGTIVNSAFQIGVSSLALLKGFVVAAFLTADDYGIWGILVVALGTLLWLKQVGIGDKYIQQDEDDQERRVPEGVHARAARQRAASWCCCSRAVPLLALVYGQPELVAPGLVLALVLPADGAAGAALGPLPPDGVRPPARCQAVDPVVGFVVTIALAVGGRGLLEPRPRARRRRLGRRGRRRGRLALPAARCAYDRGTLREYFELLLAAVRSPAAERDRHRAGRRSSPASGRSASPPSARSRWPRRSPSSRDRVDAIVTRRSTRRSARCATAPSCCSSRS